MSPERRVAALVGLARRGFFFREPSLVLEQFQAICTTIFVVAPSSSSTSIPAAPAR